MRKTTIRRLPKNGCRVYSASIAASSNNVKASGSLTRGGAYTVERATPANSHCLANAKDLWGLTHSLRSAKG